MQNRREFIHRLSHLGGGALARPVLGRLGLASATAPLWCGLTSNQAFAQSSSRTYKAVVVITLMGGNDGNNILVPLDAASYTEYSLIRSGLALSASACLPLSATSQTTTYGLHPTLKNVQSLFEAKRAAVVANIGPLQRPATKKELLANSLSRPEALENHPAQQKQWESATTVEEPVTGWGGRMADFLASDSGSLPPVLNAALNSVFCTGTSVQGIAVQSGGAYPALPPGMNDVLLQIAQGDAASTNQRVAQVGAFRLNAIKQQVILSKAMAYGSTIQHAYTNSEFGRSLRTIAALIAGRSVVGASRQIFYTQQGGYDTHANQLILQSQLLSDLDINIGRFFATLDDLGLSNDVLVCTHSDFCRTLTGNSTSGSDHAWGNCQFILGGGIQGGRIIGTPPILELGGPDDLSGLGVWVPTLSVTQMTGAIGTWLGLDQAQNAQVFPDLVNFPDGPISLS